MQEHNLFLTFVRPLNKSGIKYAVTGSFAVIIYGEPRVTHDIDLVVSIERSGLELFSSLFPPEEFYMPPLEALEVEFSRTERGHFNVIHFQSGFKADFYLLGSDRFIRWGLNNSRTIHFGGEPVKIAPPEYVIIKKLEFYREGNSSKHISDIRNILEYSKDKIDLPLLEKFLDEFSLRNEWNAVVNPSSNDFLF